MAEEDLKAELERLKAENEALKERHPSAVSMKVSEKWAVSVYGLRRFRVTGRTNRRTRSFERATPSCGPDGSEREVTKIGRRDCDLLILLRLELRDVLIVK